MGYFMPVAESVANGFFLDYFFIGFDQIVISLNFSRDSYSFTILK